MTNSWWHIVFALWMLVLKPSINQGWLLNDHNCMMDVCIAAAGDREVYDGNNDLCYCVSPENWFLDQIYGYALIKVNFCP
jgi:hypothetical protein